VHHTLNRIDYFLVDDRLLPSVTDCTYDTIVLSDHAPVSLSFETSRWRQMEELAALTRLQREYRECSLMHFTETLAEPPHPGLTGAAGRISSRQSGQEYKGECFRQRILKPFSSSPGIFNHASLSATLPNFHQYVNCCTRDNKTLDLLYANTAGAYSSSPLPPLGRSDHNLVHLRPVYTPMVKRQPPNKRRVKQWSEEASDALRDCFDTTDWEVLCGPHEQDIDSLTDCITDYINFCVETTVPTKRVQCFSNNKPWVTPDLRALLQEKRTAFQSGRQR
ncbi:hypothetical protein L3Q82_017155, partial [Scortum barcoo]